MSAPDAAPTGVMMACLSAPGFKTVLTHGPSGTSITTEAPKDNGGTGMSFSPTDLVGAALAACVVTTMHLTASREGIALGEVRASVEKRMTPPPRRIGALIVEVQMPPGLSPEHRARLEEAGRGCPIARSLKDGTERLTFHYEE